MRVFRRFLFFFLAMTTGAHALDRDVLLDEANLLLLPRERAIPALHLVDQDGQAFDTRDLRDRWHLLFLGFTACPDVCPTTLSDLRRLLGRLQPELRERVQVVLVSVDPARDTPERLKQYLAYYRSGFKGLTGELSELTKLSKALGLPFVPANTADGDYSVSHSGNIALVAPDGSLRGHIRAPLKLNGLADALQELVKSQ
ncbi:SCO family protein [Stutzerimonas degradans]|uniref:Cytochrome c oxidase assembly protein n=1 Tax=Stutzerimonas degradans TaxID=2968968 RepID=A0A8E2U1P2_9GAMM|nr:SCO family protein [Stutzerimonas degradans]MCQ4275878.1 SCO family protein [Stutzerimonas degradans]PNF76931.1 cytochrome c oxidase assembly protein [Stutzerimonas degradans]QPT22668.1 SCO family protein [Stutzerimonas degradans]